MSNVSALTQTLTKLHDASKQKLKLGYQSHKISELQQIWNNIIHSSDSVSSHISCKAIVALLQDGMLNTNDVLETIVNHSPSSKNTQWLVHLTTKVLKLQFHASAEKCDVCSSLHYKNPYGLASSPHPLISMMVSAPQSWNNILTEIQALCFDCITFRAVNDSNESDILQILAPFFVYVFFKPSISEVAVLQKTSLFSAILNFCFISLPSATNIITCQHELSLLKFLGDVITHFTLTETNLQLFMQFYAAVNTSSHLLNDNTYVTKFCLSVLSSCFASIDKCYATSVAQLFYQCVKSMMQSIQCVDVILLGLSHLICKASEETLNWLLHGILYVLPSPAWKLVSVQTAVTCYGSLKAALLQLLLNKGSFGFTTILSLIHKTLKAVDSKSKDLVDNAESFGVETNVKFHDLNKKSWMVAWLCDNFILLEGFASGNGLEHLSCVLDIYTSQDMVQKATLLVCGVLLYDSMPCFFEKNIHANCLDLLCNIASLFPSITFTMLPTILHCLRIEKNPQHLQSLAFLLPKLATHNGCIAPILGTIQAFYKVTSLQPLSLYLLLKLWKKQERCFPYLHKTLMQKSHFNSVISCELNTIKVIVLRDVCKTVSFKNTGEILAMISTMLKSSLTPANVVFLLEGMYYLFESKHVDICTTWLTLKESIMSHKSNSITNATLKILSLVPKLEVNTAEYAHFKEEIVSWIWSNVENQSSEVVGNTLVSLSFFKVEDFKIKHFPKVFRPDISPLSPDESEDVFEEQSIPGSWYLHLMNSPVLSEQAQFLFTSILKQEIENLPRDIKDRALKSQRSSHSSSFSLHSFILNMYERNKQPNLKSGIATALLMCYNPICDSSTPKHMVSLSRNALQHLQALLSEVTIDPKNWSSILWLTRAWKSFMQKTFSVMVQGRQAELQMQLQQKGCDKDEVSQKLDTCSFWCRDKITDILKTASKGTPSMQGSAILAMAGLMCALKSKKEENNKNEDKIIAEENVSSGFLSYNHWCGMAADTLISVADNTYQPPGRIFSWCQYRAVSKTGRLTTSILGKVCAMHSFTLMGSTPMIRNDNKRIGGMINFLWNHVNIISSGICSEDDESDMKNPTIALHLYLSFSTLVAQMFHDKFHEICDPSLKSPLYDCASMLCQNIFNPSIKEDVDDDDSFDDDDEDDSDQAIRCLIGIGLILPSMFSSENMILKENAKSLVLKFDSQFEDITSNKSPSYQNAFVLSLTWSCVAGTNAKVLDSSFSSSVLQKLHKMSEKNKTNAMFSQSVAMMCCTMYFHKDNQTMILFDELFDRWHKQASNDKISTRQKLSCINGLAALVGSELLFTYGRYEHTEQFDNRRNQVIQLLQHFSRNVKESGIANNVMLLLGHLYLSSQNWQNTPSSIPSTFNYLPETSILKPIFQIIANARIKYNDGSYKALLKTVMKTLSEASCTTCKTLPPVVWGESFSTILQLNLDDNVQNDCFLIALSQCHDNQTAAAFITNWIQPQQFKTLHSSTQCIVLKHMNLLIKSLSTTKIIMLLDTIVPEVLQSPTFIMNTSLLQGMLSSLKMKDLPQEMPNCLFSNIKRIVKSMTFTLTDESSIECWTILSDCLNECDDCSSVLDCEIDATSVLKVTYIKCHLIPHGFRSMQWLNDALESCASCNNLEIQTSSLWLIYHCMKNILLSKTELCSTTKMMEWLQELMGHIRKVLDNKSCFEFFMKIFSITVIAWSEQRKVEGKRSEAEFLSYNYQHMEHLWTHCLYTMPSMLKLLLSKTPWEEYLFQLTVEWLLYLYQHTIEHDNIIRTTLKESLLELQQNKLYFKTQVWRNVVATLILY